MASMSGTGGHGPGAETYVPVPDTAELLRAELAPRELLFRTLVVLGLVIGSGCVAAGFDSYDRGHPSDGAVSLGVAGVLLAGSLLGLTLLFLQSRDRNRLLRAYGPKGLAFTPPLKGLRGAWRTVSGTGIALGVLFFAAGTFNAFQDDPYEEPDPLVYGALLLWSVLLFGAGGCGWWKAGRHTPPVPAGPAYGYGPAPGAPVGAGGPPYAAPEPPSLYSRLGGEPAAPHRLSARLSARIAGLSRGAAVSLAAGAALLACLLAGAEALLPRLLGDWAFWPLFSLTALFLLLLLVELVHYGPRRRYSIVFLLAGCALLAVAGNGFSAAVLLDRGEWVRTEVTEVKTPRKGSPFCVLRRTDSRTELAKPLSPCGGGQPGDIIRVHHDPEGETGPRRTAPSGLGGYYAGWGITSAVLVTSASLTASYGHRRRRELGLLP